MRGERRNSCVALTLTSESLFLRINYSLTVSHQGSDVLSFWSFTKLIRSAQTRGACGV
jgi:hypothetical protein